jgi:hypothetical protein
VWHALSRRRTACGRRRPRGRNGSCSWDGLSWTYFVNRLPPLGGRRGFRKPFPTHHFLSRSPVNPPKSPGARRALSRRGSGGVARQPEEPDGQKCVASPPPPHPPRRILPLPYRRNFQPPFNLSGKGGSAAQVGLLDGLAVRLARGWWTQRRKTHMHLFTLYAPLSSLPYRPRSHFPEIFIKYFLDFFADPPIIRRAWCVSARVPPRLTRPFPPAVACSGRSGSKPTTPAAPFPTLGPPGLPVFSPFDPFGREARSKDLFALLPGSVSGGRCNGIPSVPPSLWNRSPPGGP